MKRKAKVCIAAVVVFVPLLTYWLSRPSKPDLVEGTPPPQRIESTEVQSIQLSHAVDYIAFSSAGDSLFILTRSRDSDESRNIVRCTLEGLQSTELHSTFETLQGFARSPDGEYVYTAQWRTGPEKKAELLQIDTRNGGVKSKFAAASLDGHGFRITSDPTALGISPDGDFIAIGAKLVDDQHVAGGHIGGEVWVWDIETGDVIWSNRTTHTDILRNVVFSRDGTKLITAGDDSLIRIWDARDGELQSTLVGVLFDGVSSMTLSPDGRYLATGGQGREEGGRVRVWDLKQQTFTHLFQPFAPRSNVHVTFCDDGTLVAAGVAKGSGEDPSFELHAWRANDLSKIGEIGKGEGWVRALAAAPSRPTVSVGTWEGGVHIYDFNVSDGRTEP